MTTRLQPCDAAGLQPVDQIGQRVDQFAAHRAAQAAVGQLDDAVGRLLDQQMVDRHVAELVDDDGGVGERRILEQPVEQRRLAGAEEAGEHRDGDRESCHRLIRGLTGWSPWRRAGRAALAAGAIVAGTRARRDRHVGIFLAVLVAHRHRRSARWRRRGRRSTSCGLASLTSHGDWRSRLCALGAGFRLRLPAASCLQISSRMSAGPRRAGRRTAERPASSLRRRYARRLEALVEQVGGGIGAR